MPSGFTARPRRPFVPSVRIPDGPCERPRGSRSCSRRGVNNAAELSTSDCKPLIYNGFSTTCHSHSIVNGPTLLVGEKGPPKSDSSANTDIFTVGTKCMEPPRHMPSSNEARHALVDEDRIRGSEAHLTVSELPCREPMTVSPASMTVSLAGALLAGQNKPPRLSAAPSG